MNKRNIHNTNNHKHYKKQDKDISYRLFWIVLLIGMAICVIYGAMLFMSNDDNSEAIDINNNPKYRHFHLDDKPVLEI